MKKIIFYGNCQVNKTAWILGNCLPKKKYQNVRLEQVQNIKSSEYFNRSWVRQHITTADIAIIQTVSSPHTNPFIHIVPFLKNNAHVIIMDSLYCKSFHPDCVSTSRIPSFKICCIHDVNILSAYVNGISVSKFIANDPFNISDFYDKNHLENNHKDTIRNLESRRDATKALVEKYKSNQHQIKFSVSGISDFLNNKSNIKTCMWGDFNHPLNCVYKYNTSKLCNLINVEFDELVFDENFNSVNNEQIIIRPPCKSVIRYFGFDNETENRNYSFTNDYFGVSREQYIHDVYDFYAKCDKQILTNEYEKLV